MVPDSIHFSIRFWFDSYREAPTSNFSQFFFPFINQLPIRCLIDFDSVFWTQGNLWYIISIKHYSICEEPQLHFEGSWEFDPARSLVIHNLFLHDQCIIFSGALLEFDDIWWLSWSYSPAQGQRRSEISTSKGSHSVRNPSLSKPNHPAITQQKPIVP